MSKRIRAHIFLLTTAFIWGSAFVAQRVAMDNLGPFTFTGLRMFIGGFVLIPVILLLRKKEPATTGAAPQIGSLTGDPTFIGGFFCGVALFLAGTFQQVGLVYTTAGKAGFITALYIIIVPILGIFMKKKVSKLIWLCVALALVGVYLLCMKGDFTMNKGDLIMFLSALGYAVHILTVDHFSPMGDPVKMSSIQFFVCGTLCLPMLVAESPAVSDLLAAWFPLFYTGVISCGVAYTLQVVAQRDTTPTITAIILSFESVFAVLSELVILRVFLIPKEVIGCILMFAAIIMAQMPEKPIKTEKEGDIDE
ncbi:MAG: DMT family transporter [Clostridiales bacterium]|nr:DMT family transporter [Clostridiales bacterium]